jgi:hypothetical protein
MKQRIKVYEGAVEPLFEPPSVPTDQQLTEMLEPVNDPLNPSDSTEVGKENLWYGNYSREAVNQFGLSVLLYGESGSGKTTFASTFPKPIFFDLDGGLASIAHKNPMRYPRSSKRVVTRYSEITKFFTLITTELQKPEPGFKTIVVDSLNELQEVTMNHVLQDYPTNRQYDDNPTLADYGKALRDFIRIVQSFKQLPCNVVFIASSAPRQYEDEQTFPLFVGKQTLLKVAKAVDMVGYCFSEYAENRQEVRYKVNFVNTPRHLGKNRLQLPARDFPTDYTKIFSSERIES